MRFSLIKKKSFFHQTENWCEEGVDDGFSPRENMALYRKAEVEEAAGNSRKESVSLSLFMELNNLQVR